ncbi:hypothetical protein GGR56DRAFT_87384 [Xylariaceae sp. FL0804]|nr:hypothetical protein GGR56DRAFT_87384 [Xylariaceae sp. FL0804]
MLITDESANLKVQKTVRTSEFVTRYLLPLRISRDKGPKVSHSRRHEHRAQMRSISRFLSAPERPEAELLSIKEKQAPGSCCWLTEKPSFQDWQAGYGGNPSETPPRCFWLSGNPGTGKSVVTGHVIRYLEECNADCSYYFFRHNNKERSTVACFLRSMACQMAEMHTGIRRELLSMIDEEEVFNKDDERSVWRSLFTSRILRKEFPQPIYWVTDALDECSDYLSFFRIISEMDGSAPIRVFATSRPLPLVERHAGPDKRPFVTESITKETTQHDIRLFLEAHPNSFPVQETSACDQLMTQICEKSNGSFLWASLVLKELEITVSEQQIHDVLNEVPSEMDDLYGRILHGISAIPRNYELAKAILRWTICAARPLTVEELKEALRLDNGHVIPKLESVVGQICGYLVHVARNNTVQVVHATVRSYLTQPGLNSDLMIDSQKEHSHIARVCLSLLCGKDLSSPKSLRGSARPVQRSPFADYAVAFFSEHVCESSSSIDEVLGLLDTFFKTNVLSWIEVIAQSGSLSTLLQTSRNLKAYLNRRAKARSSHEEEFQAAMSWTDDLRRLVAAFGRNLVSYPGSIHFHIPPVCPLNSMIYRTFQDASRPFEVVGLSYEDWDDRISCMEYADWPLAIACSKGRFAVALTCGDIIVYRASTLEVIHSFEHPKETQNIPVYHRSKNIDHICFARQTNLLASCGGKHLALWDVQNGTRIWSTEITWENDPVLSLSFNQSGDFIMLALQSNKVVSFRLQDGGAVSSSRFFNRDNNNDTTDRDFFRQACFSPELNMLGVEYYGKNHISFWDLEDNSWLGYFHKGDTNQYPGTLLEELAINPNPELVLAAAAYEDRDLVVFSPFDGQQRAVVKTSARVTRLASSSDGKILATGGRDGTIQLFDFETLHLLYRSSLCNEIVRSLAFSSDNLRLFDIRYNYCNTWEPTVLLRKGDPDGNISEPYSDEVTHQALLMEDKSLSEDNTITAICEYHDGSAIFCGCEDGSVYMYTVQTGTRSTLIVPPTLIPIRRLACCPMSGRLATSDFSGRFTVRPIATTAAGSWKAGQKMLDEEVEEDIQQILFDPSGSKLLVSTDDGDHLWSVDGVHIVSYNYEESRNSHWISHPSSTNNLIRVKGTRAWIFEWSTLTPLSKPIGVDPYRTNSAHFHSFDVDHKCIIGVYKSRIIFLDIDGWVCSVNIDSLLPERHYSRHFLIPFSWHNNSNLLFTVTIHGSVAMALRDEVAIFHNGLDYFEDRVPLDPQQGTHSATDLVTAGSVQIS